MRKRLLSCFTVLLLIFAMIPASAYAADAVVIKIADVTAKRGETVEVAVKVTQNPGIIGGDLSVSWDSSALTLTDITEGFLSFGEELQLPYTVDSNGTKTYRDGYESRSSVFLGLGSDVAETNITSTGTLVTLVFRVKDTAEEGRSYAVTANPDDAVFIETDYPFEVPSKITAGSVKVSIHQHIYDDSSFRDQIPATCTESGRIAVYQCTVCGKLFSDREMTNEVTEAETVIPALGHSGVVHYAAKAANASADGNIEYWYCPVCGKYYSDSALTKEITLADTVIPKGKGDINADGVVDAKDMARLKRYLADDVKYPLTEDQEKAADVNGDSVVDAKDMAKIKRYLADEVKYPL